MSTSHSKRRRDTLASLPQVQRERLAYIDFRLYFLGDLRRSDLTDRFGTAPAAATRDIATYKEIAPDNLQFDQVGKNYLTSAVFSPVFDHAPQQVLTALSRGFGEGLPGASAPLLRCEVPAVLSQPTMDILAPITRAMHRNLPVRLIYYSMSSGKQEREIVPFALVHNGVRWHVRAYDRKSKDFRDFVFTRMERPVISEGPLAVYETAESDLEWSRIVDLQLVPHPMHPRHDVIKLEYGMPDGVLRIRVRATNVGYVLRSWNVDCSPDHHLRGPEYSLWLRDPLQLYGIRSAVLAPGWQPPSARAARTAQ